MAGAILSTIVLAALTTLFFVLQRFRVQTSQLKRDSEAEKPSHLPIQAPISYAALQLRAKLQQALPGIVICPDAQDDFKRLMDAHWAQQACEVAPACVLRPRNAQELALAVRILKAEFDACRRGEKHGVDYVGGLFAIRGGGHSPVAGAATVSGGVLVDMSLFNQVVLSTNRETVTIGAGCKWSRVYESLGKINLAVVGGRNSAVGCAGLALGGGLSFFSPRFGFVCSNILEYQVVLADGSVVTASAAEHSDLWRALKGGSNNFGIVTSFTARTFPLTKVWSGFLYMLPSQASNCLRAFHEYLDRVVSDDQGKTYDQYAAGPLACFTYLSKSGIQAIAVNIVHTKLSGDHRGWPTCWRKSRFASLWRLWSTCKARTLISATDELHALNLPGRRQTWGTTTITNDIETLLAVHGAYRAGVQRIRQAGVKDVSWTLVLQPLLPDWARKGHSNPLGLDAYSDEPLVIVQFTVNWATGADDEEMEKITRAAIEQIDSYARANETGHRYKYLNYCGIWQDPFSGYGHENLMFLREVSREYDPDGLFQYGCTGGFKLG